MSLEAKSNCQGNYHQSESAESEAWAVHDAENQDESRAEKKDGCGEVADCGVDGFCLRSRFSVKTDHGEHGEDAEEKSREGEDLAEGSGENEADGQSALEPDDPRRNGYRLRRRITAVFLLLEPDDPRRNGYRALRVRCFAVPTEHGVEDAWSEEGGGAERGEESEGDDGGEDRCGVVSEELADEEFDDGAAFGKRFERDVL